MQYSINLNKTINYIPFLVLFTFFTNLYFKNTSLFNLGDLIVLFLFIGILLLLVLILFNKLFSNKFKSCLFTSVLITWFFSYSQFREFFYISNPFQLGLYHHRYFIIIWILLLIILFLIVYFRDSNFKKTNTIVIIINIILLLFVVPKIYKSGFEPPNKNITQNLDKGLSIQPKKLIISDQDSLPDIYYIILDSYSGNKSLSHELKYNNNDFISFLETKGFFIAHNSYANYSWTSLSLTSTLNMSYFPMSQLTNNQYRLSDSANLDNRIKLFDFNLTERLLTTIGYSVIKFSYKDSYTTDFLTSHFMNSFINILSLTVLSKPVAENYLHGQIQRSKTLAQFNRLKNISKTNKPKFVFCHFLLPHEPYIFNKNGIETNSLSTIFNSIDQKQKYLEQLNFTNHMIRCFINDLLKKTKTKPIIIIQGDHGAPFFMPKETSNLNLRMNILNCYLIPQNVRKHLYQSISPVNSFRILFKYQFGMNIDLLPDEHFYAVTERTNRLIRIDSTADFIRK